MFEKPQYMTPEGFKRLAKNPYSDRLIAKRLLMLKKKRSGLLDKKGGGAVSDDAAKLIAEALKGLLHSKHRGR